MKDASPEGGKDAYTRDKMQDMARAINEMTPQDWGFFLMVFPFNDAQGRMNYVSNGAREDILKLMQEFIAKGGPTGKHENR